MKFSPILNFLKKGLVTIVILAGFFGGFTYLQSTKKEVVATPPEEQVWTIQAITAVSDDISPTEQAFGTVSSGRGAQLRFGVAGEVISVSERLRNGVDVEKGEILARLDSERSALALEEVKLQLAAEKRQISQLETQLEVRTRMYERALTLFEKAVGSQAEIDASQLAVSSAANMLDQAKARQAQLKVAAKRHQKDIDDAELKAPFDGTLSAVELALGNQVNNSHLVAHLTDLSRLEVSFVAPVSIYQNINALIGSKVQLRWTSGTAASAEVSAVITRAEIIVDRSEGGGRLYAELPENAARNIPPGAFVEVLYKGQSFTDVIAVPEEALFGSDTVYVIKEGRARKRLIEVKHRSPGAVLIAGDIQDGEQIVATRLPGIGDGIRVRVAPVQNAS
ncbi:MAG: efflux RND transporter periplasmic adaptor subunit [Alphaproteobacteria bacterium]|nr:efflux RND transporter periplasmic adaptor subunit [Alphaproteobacteria bacterium]MBL6777592.1 efflux RND transporter periplasmic adaptor subunit [Alphaproteobacteria bacterium]